MKPVKTLYLKTYGRQQRKLSAWISPGNRKQAFDSSVSTDGDGSVFEAPKPASTRPRRTSVASHRVLRPAKKKAMQCLKEKSFDENNVTPSPPLPQPAKQSKTTREKRISVRKARHPAKRKAKSSMTEDGSDEENVGSGNSRMPPPPPSTHQHSKNTRKSGLVSVPGALMKWSRQHGPLTSESEEDLASTKYHTKMSQMKRTSNAQPLSAGRFVTRRRHAGATKSKLTQATVNVLDSSDDFTSGRGALASCRLHPPRRKRKVLSLLTESSVENSVNATGADSFATTNSFREISLSESADHSIRLYPRKPIFCSTPSASCLPLPINGQSSNPPSLSVSCEGLSPFQKVLESQRQPCLTSPIVLPSEENQQKQAGMQELEELSADLFRELKSKTSSFWKVAKDHSEALKTGNVGALPSLNLSTTDTESNSSHFVSAAGGLEWLLEALKEKCLTQQCSVLLERLDYFPVTQFCSQTTYSSCLELPSSVHSQQIKEHVFAERGRAIDPFSSLQPAFSLSLSVTKDETSHPFLAVNNRKSRGRADCNQSDGHSPDSNEQSPSVCSVESTHHTSIWADSPGSSPAQTFTEDVQNKKFKLQVKRQTLSQLKEAGMACDIKDLHPDENDRPYNTEEISERKIVTVRQQTNDNVTALTQSTNPEVSEKTETLSKREKCLTSKPVFEIKRLTLSQFKEIRQRREFKSTREVSDISSGLSDLQSESDTSQSSEEIRVDLKKRGSASFDNNVGTDKEVAVQNCEVPPKRKKNSLAPKERKRRSTSMDRPRMTRKVCVSGLSVSRWKNKSSASTHVFDRRIPPQGATKTVDCSMNDLIATKAKQSQELIGTTMNFSTPLRESRLNLSSLLAELTPNTHTWSRLKAALSVHRKVLLTPGSLCLSETRSSRRRELADISQDLFATPHRTPLPKRLRSHLLSCSSLVTCEEADLSDAEKVYAECSQQGPLAWEECILPHRMKQCVKIGEGTFGEVFSSVNGSGDTVALKVIPLEGSEKVNGEDQKTFGEILHEIIISKELSTLKEKQQNQSHGFIGLNDLHCVQGCYPAAFLKAWDAFDHQKGSENDRPDFFKKDQLFIILEFEFGGIDLENSNGKLASLGVAKSILHQVTAALAVAEQELHFEHRDLHWGNVLVKTTKQKKWNFLLNGTVHSLETRGVLIRIIDYSLSRLEIDDLTVSCDISNDEELFMGQGDYQFDIYRLMRQENGNNWSDYHPRSNVLWLHYLCSKLLSMKYRGPGGRGAKDIRGELTCFYDNILQYSSATEALQKCPMFQ